MQSLLGLDKFGGGVLAWLINNVHVIVEGPWRCIGPFLSLMLLVSFLSPLELDLTLLMLVAWLPSLMRS
jgi:hypothetical protein